MARTLGVLLFEGFQLLDAAGPIAAFEIAGEMAEAPYRMHLLSRAGGSVNSSSGVALQTRAMNLADRMDTLIVVGGLGSDAAALCGDHQAFIRTSEKVARRLCSVCSGAKLLAAAGMLDGRRATTHWRAADKLARKFPAVQVEPDAIHIRDGHIWTSAGVSAGIDLALALIADDLGEALARRVAQEMVVYYRRPGGQSQFSSLADMGRESSIFSPLLDWMRSHSHERLTIEKMADRAAMSPRNFSRAFKKAIGVSPAKAVERLRLEDARERVEYSEQPIEKIAVTSGFGDPERMRRAFLRAFGQPPQALRRIKNEPR
jgi:transcriptional regulator GlxA family with amidase domain